VRFKTTPAAMTGASMHELIALWDEALTKKWAPSLVLVAAWNLDFLCIHPFRDGNGRISRLLLLLHSYHLGFEVGRYISLERLVEQNKDRYYETLELSSVRWHEGKHDPWPYINFILFILKSAYREFEERVSRIESVKGTKSELIKTAVISMPDSFRIADIEKLCPGCSIDLVRKVMKDLRTQGIVECIGKGRDARWILRNRTNRVIPN
jgi:Fic family protein